MTTVTDYTQDGLSLANVCPQCIEQEQLCTDCVDQADARLTDKAYALVDEGNMQYRRNWSRADEQPSASDWVSSETVSRESKYMITLELITIKTGTYTDSQGYTRQYNENWYHMEEKVIVTRRDTNWLIRKEYTEPIVQLIDGGVVDNLWELDDLTQYNREVVCPSCHLTTPKILRTCQTCDKSIVRN